jgi:hypothetical protein
VKKASKKIKKRLMSIIREMACDPGLFVKNPGKDFTRKRKLGFADMLTMLLGMGGGSLQTELLVGKGYAADTATASAFIQQREKILTFALEYILHEFAPKPSEMKRHKGYRLLAVDGSDLHTTANPKEADNFFQGHPGEKGYNLLHLNALYDLCNAMYIDALLQSRRAANEHKALTVIVDRACIHDKAILIADRGYESYNNLAHIERKGWNYLIRIKDVSSTGILAGLNLPKSGEFDVDIQRILTRRQTKEVKARPELYRFLPSNSTFDLLDPHDSTLYPISFRIVRFKLAGDTYETVITNLGRDAFPSLELKKLYHMRWGVETAFRALKYAVGLVSFHSKRAEYISQEVFAALIMYNFAQWIASHATIRPKDTRYDYQINFSFAIRICKRLFLCRDPVHPPDVEALILANTLPVRNGRCFPRKVRFRQAVSFCYRIA